MVAQAPIRELVQRCPVIPVLVIDRVEDAAPLAEALVAGGLDVLEVTMRTPVALDALVAMKRAVPKAAVGAGTVNTPAQMKAVSDAGAAFAVSPGTTAAVVAAATDHRVPLLPGVATASEVMARLEQGIDVLKFFPAEAAGGVAMLKSWAGPLAEARFCPTGGVRVDNAPSYLALSNVACVGGSWVAPKAAVERQDWAAIEGLAREAAGLRGS